MISQEQIDAQKNIVKNLEKEIALYESKIETLTKDAIRIIEEEVKKYKNKSVEASTRYQVAVDDLLRLEDEANVNRVGEGGC